jgi:hypothetical protein
MGTKTKSIFLALICTPLAAVLTASVSLAAPAPDGNSVLILSTTDGGLEYSAEAAAQGFTAVVVDPATWATYTQEDFATFRAIIMGDPTCVTGTGPVAAAEANRALWSAAVGGPMGPNPKLLTGTDEQYHSSQGGAQLISSGISFVTSAAGQTGLYISLSCYYNNDPEGTPVPLLDEFGTFTVGEVPGCFDAAHIVATHPALEGLEDSDLSNWGCSVHEVFNSFPAANFIPPAIADGETGTGSMTFADGSTGIPYILASGEGVRPTGELAPVPTLSWWALLGFAMLLGLWGLLRVRHQQ